MGGNRQIPAPTTALDDPSGLVLRLTVVIVVIVVRCRTSTEIQSSSMR